MRIYLLSTDRNVFRESLETKDLTKINLKHFKIDSQSLRFAVKTDSSEEINAFFLRNDNFPLIRAYARRKQIPLIEILSDNPLEIYQSIINYTQIKEGLYIYLGRERYTAELMQFLGQSGYQTASTNLDSL